MSYLPIVIVIFLIMFNKKVRLFIRNNKTLVLAILYKYMALWFSYILLRADNFKSLFDMIKINGLYIIELIIIIVIPLFFIKEAITSWIKYSHEKKPNK